MLGHLHRTLLFPPWHIENMMKLRVGSCNWIRNNGNGGNGMRNPMVDTSQEVSLLNSSMLILKEMLNIWGG